MYAILQHGGHQYRVTAGDRLLVDRLPAEVGSVVALEPVVLFADGDRLETGGDAVAGMRVAATVVAHRRGRKLRVFKYKAKKRNRRTLGFRADLTELVVGGVLLQGEALPDSPAVAEAPSAPEKRRGRGGVAPVDDDAVSGTDAVEAAAVETAPEAGSTEPAPAEAGLESGAEPVAEVKPRGRARARVHAEAEVEAEADTAAAADAGGAGAAAESAETVADPHAGSETSPAPAKRRRVARKAPEPDTDEPTNEA